MRRPVLFVSALVVAGVIYHFLKPDSWLSFVYPDRGDLSVSSQYGPYGSLEDCRDSSRRILASLPGNDDLRRGDYECGKNCDDGSKLGGIRICEETTR